MKIKVILTVVQYALALPTLDSPNQIFGDQQVTTAKVAPKLGQTISELPNQAHNSDNYNSEWHLNTNPDKKGFSGLVQAKFKRLKPTIDDLELQIAAKKLLNLRDSDITSIDLENSSRSGSNTPNTSILLDMPNYTLARKLRTIKQIWQEYSVGINGQPSVKSLEEKYGTNWRNSDNEIKLYSYRNKIYRAIQKLIAKGITEEEAIKELESIMKANNWSLSKLQKLPENHQLFNTGT